MSNTFNNKYEKYIASLRKRGLIIYDDELNEFREIFYKENHLNVIENYEEPFLDDLITLKFRKNINLRLIYNFYNFDKKIKLIYFKFILKVELQIKTVIANVFISSYGNKDYLKPENFAINSLNGQLDVMKMKQVIELIIKLESTLANKLDKNKKNHKFIFRTRICSI